MTVFRDIKVFILYILYTFSEGERLFERLKPFLGDGKRVSSERQKASVLKTTRVVHIYKISGVYPYKTEAGKLALERGDGPAFFVPSSVLRDSVKIVSFALEEEYIADVDLGGGFFETHYSLPFADLRYKS